MGRGNMSFQIQGYFLCWNVLEDKKILLGQASCSINI